MARKFAVLLVVIGCVFGVTAGVGGYTFYYAKGAAYLTNDPTACTNCHVMNEQFSGWEKSSHRNVAVCNDCHAPHDLIGKYTTKAINGFNHSLAFTTGRFHEPIEITERNHRITENACRSCHAETVAQIDRAISGHAEAARPGDWESISCVRCHRSVGHLH